MSQLTHALRLGRQTAITNPAFAQLLAALRRMHKRWRQRQDLRELDDHQLRDIGITREQARHETNKPFWR